jgi:GNAT superfamily N-acetyltransferase
MNGDARAEGNMTNGQSIPKTEYEMIDLTPFPDMRLAHDFYESVLAPSFPRDEIEPLRGLTDALSKPPESRPRIVLALDKSRNVVGGIVGEWYPHSRVLLIAYLATRPDLRGSGIGYRLTKVVSDWALERRSALIIAEIEPPDRSPVAEAYGDPVARLRLFDRLRGRVLDMPYWQPRLSPDRNRVPLLLVAFHIDSDACDQEENEMSIPADLISIFLDEYFSACEGEEEGVARGLEYSRMQNFLQGTSSVSTMPVKEYLRMHGYD